MTRYGLSWTALVGVAILLAACAPSGPEYYGTTYEPVGESDDFELTNQHGEPFRLADYRGKVVLLFFGYAHCPDVCPVTLSTWSRVHEELGADEDVEFVFITVDPERDTAERLRGHLSIFGEGIHGLTGTEEELESVYGLYGIHHDKVGIQDSEIGYVVDHSTLMLLLDREGRLRVSFPFDAEAEKIVHDVKRILRS
jgi:protein SCO1/2